MMYDAEDNDKQDKEIANPIKQQRKSVQRNNKEKYHIVRAVLIALFVNITISKLSEQGKNFNEIIGIVVCYGFLFYIIDYCIETKDKVVITVLVETLLIMLYLIFNLVITMSN